MPPAKDSAALADGPSTAPDDPTTAADEAPPKLGRLRLLVAFARPHRRMLLLGLLLAIGSSATQLATPMVTRDILSALADSESMTRPIVLLAGLVVVGAAAGLIMWITLGTVGERIVLDARIQMVRRYLGATVGSIAKRPTGELVTRVTSDTVLLREAAASSFVGLFNGVVMLVGTLILMGVLDLVLLGATVAVIAVVTVLFLVLMPMIAQAQERAQEHVGRLGGRLEGAIRALRTVKSSGSATPCWRTRRRRWTTACGRSAAKRSPGPSRGPACRSRRSRSSPSARGASTRATWTCRA